MIHILQPGNGDRIILLGDMINRGPDSAGVIRFVYESGFESLLGNHEYDYLQKVTQELHYRKIHETIGPEIHRWIESLPLYIETDRFLAVHAGLEPHRHPSQSRKELLLNIRTWDGHGKDLKSPGNPPWYTFYNGTVPIFYGHWAKMGLNLRRKERTFGLDSGCVYGRALSAFVLETGELFQVTARTVYSGPDTPKTRTPQEL